MLITILHEWAGLAIHADDNSEMLTKFLDMYENEDSDDLLSILIDLEKRGICQPLLPLSESDMDTIITTLESSSLEEAEAKELEIRSNWIPTVQEIDKRYKIQSERRKNERQLMTNKISESFPTADKNEQYVNDFITAIFKYSAYLEVDKCSISLRIANVNDDYEPPVLSDKAQSLLITLIKDLTGGKIAHLDITTFIQLVMDNKISTDKLNLYIIASEENEEDK